MQKRVRYIVSFSMLAGIVVLLLWPRATRQVPYATQPSVALSPFDVVKSQLTALKQNDYPSKDFGISVAYNYASPANRANTGPLRQFVKLLHQGSYAALLNHQRHSIEEYAVNANNAVLFAFLESATGKKLMYVFKLSRQLEAPYADMWMTDSVLLHDAVDDTTPEITI